MEEKQVSNPRETKKIEKSIRKKIFYDKVQFPSSSSLTILSKHLDGLQSMTPPLFEKPQIQTLEEKIEGSKQSNIEDLIERQESHPRQIQEKIRELREQHSTLPQNREHEMIAQESRLNMILKSK